MGDKINGGDKIFIKNTPSDSGKINYPPLAEAGPLTEEARKSWAKETSFEDLLKGFNERLKTAFPGKEISINMEGEITIPSGVTLEDSDAEYLEEVRGLFMGEKHQLNDIKKEFDLP